MLKEKLWVVLINDPGLYTGDTTLFKGREMTYYGRWTYKFEEAARHGAEGILIIHETEGAGYQYSIPRKGAITPRLYMQTADSNRTMCAFSGWLSAESADSLFKSLGYNVKELRSEACKKDSGDLILIQNYPCQSGTKLGLIHQLMLRESSKELQGQMNASYIRHTGTTSG